MALGNFEYKASTDMLQYFSSLAENFEQGIGVTLIEWRLNDEKNTLELVFKSDDDEQGIARFNDPTNNASQMNVVLSQVMEMAMEMGHKLSKEELQELIGNADWDATLMEQLWDGLIGVHGRGKICYKDAYVEYDAESPEFTGQSVEEIKKTVMPFIGFGRFPFFYKDGNTTPFKKYFDKKNSGKFSDHLEFVLKPKAAAAMQMGAPVAIPDDQLFK